MTTVKRKRYTTEFKQNAVQLVLAQGYSQKQAADSLGVSPSAIARWVIAAQDGEQGFNPTSLPGTQEQNSHLEQIKKLQLENEQLRKEKDVLKKAAAIFATESVV